MRLLNKIIKTFRLWFAIHGLLFLSPAVFAQYALTYQTNGSAITLTGYTGTPATVTVPNFVTCIGAFAFVGCASLTNVTILNGVTSIELAAFNDCTNLTSVTMDTNLASIGTNAFSFCPSLTSVAIPDSVTDIQYSAFSDCTGLTNITISTNLISIGDAVFSSCTSLKTISIPNSVTSVGNEEFDGCSSLVNLTIPNSVTNIGEGMFAWCANLTSVTIGPSVTSIQDFAFEECYNLTNIIIPDSVTDIVAYAFSYCTNLTSVLFVGNAPSAVWNSFYAYSGYSPDNPKLTAYCLPGTTGWSVFSATTDIPAVLWNPSIESTNSTFGMQDHQFGFSITGTPNIPIVVETCTNLTSAAWTPLQSCTLTNGSIFFADSAWTNYSCRFYSIGFP